MDKLIGLVVVLLVLSFLFPLVIFAVGIVIAAVEAIGVKLGLRQPPRKGPR